MSGSLRILKFLNETSQAVIDTRQLIGHSANDRDLPVYRALAKQDERLVERLKSDLIEQLNRENHHVLIFHIKPEGESLPVDILQQLLKSLDNVSDNSMVQTMLADYTLFISFPETSGISKRLEKYCRTSPIATALQEFTCRWVYNDIDKTVDFAKKNRKILQFPVIIRRIAALLLVSFLVIYGYYKAPTINIFDKSSIETTAYKILVRGNLDPQITGLTHDELHELIEKLFTEADKSANVIIHPDDDEYHIIFETSGHSWKINIINKAQVKKELKKIVEEL